MYARIRYTGKFLEEIRVRKVFVVDDREHEEGIHNHTMRTRARAILKNNRRIQPDGSRPTLVERRATWDAYLADELWFSFRSPEHIDRQRGLIGIRAYVLTYDNTAETFDPKKPTKIELLGETMSGRPRDAVMISTNTHDTTSILLPLLTGPTTKQIPPEATESR